MQQNDSVSEFAMVFVLELYAQLLKHLTVTFCIDCDVMCFKVTEVQYLLDRRVNEPQSQSRHGGAHEVVHMHSVNAYRYVGMNLMLHFSNRWR
jgi:hypothetical protein